MGRGIIMMRFCQRKSIHNAGNRQLIACLTAQTCGTVTIGLFHSAASSKVRKGF